MLTPKLVMAAEVAEPEVKVIAEPMALPLSKNSKELGTMVMYRWSF